MPINADQEPDDHSFGHELIAGEITQQIIGAYYDVYNGLVPGYLESVYSGALGVEFEYRGLPFVREVPLAVVYRGVEVGTFRADFVVANRVLVEVKSQRELGEADRRQLLNYLRTTNSEVGLLLNFGPKAKYQRMVNTRLL